MFTTDNQFGYKPNHSTDMCIFLIKQAISNNVSHDTPVYNVFFLYASKAFDKVDHQLLFKKFVDRSTPTSIVRLLNFWYGEQKMQMRWNSVLSDSFHISNGVRQGGVLSPSLFSLYMNSLSENLNRLRVGCYIGDKLNHVFFAGDICLLAPSLNGLQDLVDMCTAYAKAHKIFFYSIKSVLLFKPKLFCVSASPSVPP